MVGKINNTNSRSTVQPSMPEKCTKKSSGFKHWVVKNIKLCQKKLFSEKEADGSKFANPAIGIKFEKVTHVKDCANLVSTDSAPLAKARQHDDVEDAGNLGVICMLESKRDNLKEFPSVNSRILRQINNKINNLRERLVSSCSDYHGCQLKILKTEAALDLVLEKFPEGNKRLESEFRSRIGKLNKSALLASKTRNLAKDEMIELANYPNTLIKIMGKEGIQVTANDIKNSLITRLNNEEWHEIKRTGSVMVNGQEYHFEQKCTPGCMIKEGAVATSKDESDSQEKTMDIFPEDYDGLGVTSHATKNTTHATNMFTSSLTNQDTGQKDLAVVRHGVNSPYGLKPGKKRTEGALNRAKEVVVAAITLKPELLEKAQQGEVVNLMLTSSSLLTPDPFRWLVNPKLDEKPMLEDQLAAYQTLCHEKPVRLKIKGADGKLMEISVNLELIPFNFGVNTFAVDSLFDAMGGWEYSDSINDNGLQRLIGSTRLNTGMGGLVGEWLEENEAHPDAEVVSTLVRQIREIYRSKSHRKIKGGAYKLSSRLIALTWLIGGVPCTNCKSGKDRTSMSVAVAESLITYIRLNNEVPNWNDVDEDEAYLVKEFCLQGAHHEIQNINTGAPGFKVEKSILKEYGMNVFEITHVRGLSDIVSG